MQKRVNRETLIARETWIHGKVEDKITRKIRTITSIQFYWIKFESRIENIRTILIPIILPFSRYLLIVLRINSYFLPITIMNHFSFPFHSLSSIFSSFPFT